MGLSTVCLRAVRVGGDAACVIGYRIGSSVRTTWNIGRVCTALRTVPSCSDCAGAELHFF